ncbi:MAG: threonylcarbamoyl-AMP synthase [Bacilli bacterium]|nr:threonylcarbamoyl-AMP synthase [Bacilli bacterium]
MAKIYDVAAVKEALKDYQETDIIAFPTDTVYGIGASPFNLTAINKIYQSKHRPQNKPLPILCANLEQIKQVTLNIPPQMEVLIKTFLPGALTVVLPKNRIIPDYVTSGLPTIGVRIPNHPIALEILQAIGPLATTSANISGSSSLNNAEDVINVLGDKIDIIINGGLTDIGIPSTVVTMEDGEIKILREGIITKEMILKALEKPLNE